MPKSTRRQRGGGKPASDLKSLYDDFIAETNNYTHVCYVPEENEKRYIVNNKVPLGNHVVVAGSFRPLHISHVAMAANGVQATKIVKNDDGTTSQTIGITDVIFEIALGNVGKAVGTLDDYQRRLDGFFQTIENLKQGLPNFTYKLVFTKAGKFIDKATLFQSATFVVGMDTADRICDAQYASTKMQLESLVADLNSLTNGNKFYVMPRKSRKVEDGKLVYSYTENVLHLYDEREDLKSLKTQEQIYTKLQDLVAKKFITLSRTSVGMTEDSSTSIRIQQEFEQDKLKAPEVAEYLLTKMPELAFAIGEKESMLHKHVVKTVNDLLNKLDSLIGKPEEPLAQAGQAGGRKGRTEITILATGKTYSVKGKGADRYITFTKNKVKHAVKLADIRGRYRYVK